MTKSQLEFFFSALCRSHHIKVEREYRFHHERKWRFDFADAERKIAIEIEGGIWTGGRHVTGAGYLKDCEKYNTAVIMGWRVLRYPTVEAMRKFPTDYAKLKEGA